MPQKADPNKISTRIGEFSFQVQDGRILFGFRCWQDGYGQTFQPYISLPFLPSAARAASLYA